MYELVKKIFPICRSITGNGVRETLKILKDEFSDLNIYEVPSGTKAFDWTVPKEWNIKNAYIENSKGNKIIDFEENNLHVVGYSLPMDQYIDLKELKKYIYTQPDNPEVIPYVTSYYSERSGFCMSEVQKNSLPDDIYHCVIDSELTMGSLTYGEIILKGQSSKEILLSTYICHPSMANNEASGPCVTIWLAKWLKSLKNRKYTYRIIFIPETIGAITYLSRNFTEMKKNTVSGFVLSCVGDNNNYSYVETKYGNTLTDKLVKNIFESHCQGYKKYSFLKRASDERQYNAPGIELPVIAFCRTKFGEFPEYHTSADNLEFISPEGLEGSFEIMKKCILTLEYNEYYIVTCMGEPQLGRRGLYPTLSQKGSSLEAKTITDFIAYADGKNDLIDISNYIGIPVEKLIPIIEKLMSANLLKIQS